jgi:peptidoglycan/xylan/chitin deacetylase (PgdA/CDA1 family)
VSRALVLTYHAIEEGEGALFVDPESFASHLDLIVESEAEVVTISELATMMRAGALRRPAVAVTFDDGMASVARTAAPLLAERGLSATVFCVAGHLGRTSDWETARPGSPALELARADEWVALAQHGFEIACHGMTHAPLDTGGDAFLRRELIEAKELLEQEIQTSVRAYAYPYGAAPSLAAHTLVAAVYESAWTTRAGYLGGADDLYRAPRVDAHYLRRPVLLRAALEGSLRPYLGVRRFGAQARRALRRDYSPVGGTT